MGPIVLPSTGPMGQVVCPKEKLPFFYVLYFLYSMWYAILLRPVLALLNVVCDPFTPHHFGIHAYVFKHIYAEVSVPLEVSPCNDRTIL